MSQDSVIAPDVNLTKISPDAILHPGCRISGAETSIGPGSEIGREGPVTLRNCQVGRNVTLHGGYFDQAVFHDGATLGSGAHVRGGTILEEEAGGAHTVGLKQTVLFPFVTLGSLINFCDVLMAGGTSRKDHGEVGSSYIHFNFTPHQDKATASLIGDVPRGVLLNKPPVFLGGQGGLVGPSRIAFGSVIAAGGVFRTDLLEENQLCVPAAPPEQCKSYDQRIYRRVDRIIKNCLIYIGNIQALKAWYQQVRVLFIRDEFDQAVFDGSLQKIDLILAERIKRLEQLAGKLETSVRLLESRQDASPEWTNEQRTFVQRWPEIRSKLEQAVPAVVSAGLIKELKETDFSDYISAIQNLSQRAQADTTEWLQAIVDESASLWD